MTKEFGAKLPTYATRFAAENQRLADMRAAATPPVEMRAAPVAPARGVMQLVADFDIQPGGTRRYAGAHWIEPMRLDVENSAARKKGGALALDQAEDRALRKEGMPLSEAEREQVLRKVDLFTPSQVAMAARYRNLVEWLAGSGIKCSKLERGSGGSNATDSFHETYHDYSEELVRIHAAIGADVVLSPRRNLDRDNARRALTVREAVDAVVLKGWTLSKVITKAGWAAKGTVRRDVRDAIRGALDRMQGYK